MLITRATAPSYENLRPLRPRTSSTFPVYHDLVETLVGTGKHPDPVLAHTLAVCGSYAYSDASTVAMIMARMGLEGNRCLAVSQTVDAMFIRSTCFLVQSHDGRALVLGYRGTEPVNLISYLGILDVDPARVSFALAGGPADFDVHAGFYRNVRATRYEVVQGLLRALAGKSILDDDERTSPLEALYFTGHSLGGAEAAILAIMITTDPVYRPIAEKLRGLYTTGQPMVGGRSLAAACDAHDFLGQNVFRYVYQHDLVPQLPPTAAGPFGHFGQEYRYRRRNDGWQPSSATRQLPNLLEILGGPAAFVARQFPLLRNVPFPASLNDHIPEHYLAALTPKGTRSEFGD